MERALALVDRWVEEGAVPGIAVAVVSRAGPVAQHVAGVMLRGGDRPVDADTLFALASLTKPLVAVAVCVAVEEGLVELDAEVAYGYALRHLLSHASGVSDDDDQPRFPPGTRRAYSNRAYRLAAEQIERASGLPFADYLRSGVLEPLGGEIVYGLPARLSERAATVYQPGTSGERELFNSEAFRSAPRASSGAFATAPGYGRLLSCLLAGGATPAGHVLAGETVDELLACQFGELPGVVAGVGEWPDLCWGLGFDVRGRRQPHWSGVGLSPTAASHFGASGTLAWLDRERGLGLVALANRSTYSGWWIERWPELTAAVLSV